MADTKPTNPKDAIGTDKVPMGLVPATAIAYAALGHLEGMLKYGLVNWREAGVRTSVYVDALLRHTAKFVDGEWADPETKVPHLGSMLACINIIIDAYEAGKLIDDRPKPMPAAQCIDRLADVVKNLRSIHADKVPTDYTIQGPIPRGGQPARCVTCGVALTGRVSYGAGDGRGQKFECEECYCKRPRMLIQGTTLKELW